MGNETSYLIEHGLTVPSSSPWCSPCLLVLANVNNCEAYLDDLVIYFDTSEAHLSTLEEVFSHFRKASLTLNLEKCEFGHGTITYLGKQVGQGLWMLRYY